MVTAVETTRLNVRCCCCTGEKLSETCKVKLKEPMPVGVPVMTPELDRFSPAGSGRPRALHVYGGVPPPASSVNE
jgi:hypothetical protein